MADEANLHGRRGAATVANEFEMWIDRVEAEVFQAGNISAQFATSLEITAGNVDVKVRRRAFVVS
jgi:hypothetical protein